MQCLKRETISTEIGTWSKISRFTLGWYGSLRFASIGWVGSIKLKSFCMKLVPRSAVCSRQLRYEKRIGINTSGLCDNHLYHTTFTHTFVFTQTTHSRLFSVIFALNVKWSINFMVYVVCCLCYLWINFTHKIWIQYRFFTRFIETSGWGRAMWRWRWM